MFTKIRTISIKFYETNVSKIQKWHTFQTVCLLIFFDALLSLLSRHRFLLRSILAGQNAVCLNDNYQRRTSIICFVHCDRFKSFPSQNHISILVQNNRSKPQTNLDVENVSFHIIPFLNDLCPQTSSIENLIGKLWCRADFWPIRNRRKNHLWLNCPVVCIHFNAIVSTRTTRVALNIKDS